jgi:hypothetical protein
LILADFVPHDLIDVPPMRAARVRVLGSGRSQRNDPDARSIAIAARRLSDVIYRRLVPGTRRLEQH